MKIALINENSQAAKNSLIFETLKEVTDAKVIKFLTMVCMEKREKAS